MCNDPKKHSVHAPFHCHPSSIDSGSNVDRMVDQSKALGTGYAVISTATVQNATGNAFTSVPLGAGDEIEGVFTSVTLASGKVIAYKI